MILPIIAYGDPVLKKVAADISADYPKLDTLISNMYETMYNAHGVGLAAPQIGLSIRLFIVDGAPFEEEEVLNFKKVFINPVITQETGELWTFNEGCLSIPEVREDIVRHKTLHLRYYDQDFNFHEDVVFSGLAARIIQHEYDHIEGKLFTDHLSGLRKRLLKKRLTDISKGKIDVSYKMRYPNK
jgi:peptide deformylase